jgi:hypothetical protein
VGLSEELRRERLHYEHEVERITTAALETHGIVTHENVREVWSAVLPTLERRLGSLLPLALYDEASFTAELRALDRSLEPRPLRGGLTLWIELAECATWIGYVCGALLVRLEQFERLQPLLQTTWTDRNGGLQPLVWLPGETSHNVGVATVDSPGEQQRWIAPAFEYLSRALVGIGWLEERYPELYAAREPRRSLAQFDLLLCIAYGFMDHRAVSFFVLDCEGAADLALRLHRDVELRTAVARALGVTLDDFTEKAPDHIRAAQGWPTAAENSTTVDNLVEYGTWRPPQSSVG